MAATDLIRFTDSQKRGRDKFLLLSRYVILVIVAVICCIWFGGCGSYVSQNPADRMTDRSGAIMSGRLDSKAVRNILGNPLITSSYWGVEIFRDANSQIEIPIAIVIPFAMVKDDIYRYTLVSYDNEQIAKGSASGIHRRPTQWRMTRPIEYENLTLHLQTGDFTFVVQWEDRYETLLVTPARRDAYLKQARLSSQCTVVIGCGTAECSDKLRLDDGPVLPLPCRLKVQNFDANALKLLWQGKQEEYEKAYPIKTYDTVAALSLAPGSHTLKAWGGHWQRDKLAGLFSGEKSITFSCRQGEILYIVIDVSAKEYSWWGAKGIEWKIDLQNKMPEFFTDRHLVLYRSDQWLVKPESVN